MFVAVFFFEQTAGSALSPESRSHTLPALSVPQKRNPGEISSSN